MLASDSDARGFNSLVQNHSIQPTLTIKPSFSWQLAIFIWALHGFILLFTLLLFPADWIYRILLSLVVVIAWYYYHQLHINKTLSLSIHQAILTSDNQWQIITTDNPDGTTAQLLTNSLLHRAFIILNFKSEKNKRHTLILPADSIPQETARKLRARIKIMRS